MLSKNQIKRIQSLARKKGRRDEGCFIAEGNKLVEDTCEAFDCELLLATHRWVEAHPARPDRPHPLFCGFVRASAEKMEAGAESASVRNGFPETVPSGILRTFDGRLRTSSAQEVTL